MQVIATAAAATTYPLACITGNAFRRTLTASEYFLESGKTNIRTGVTKYIGSLCDFYQDQIKIAFTRFFQTVAFWHSWWPV
jgi:hypothetical protein